MNVKEYLRNAMKLEKTVYTLNLTIQYLQECQKNLGIPKWEVLQAENGGNGRKN